MKVLKIGNFQKQPQGFSAFIPEPFPPQNNFNFDLKIYKKNDEATRLIGKLDGITKLLPDSDFFILMYLRKDAASSSQIEGTRATMIDAIEADANITANIPQDVDDILHYIKALNYGMERITKDDFPMTLRFIRELHKELMSQARQSHFSDPGEFRKSQNWIGGTRPDNASFVPPPVHEMNKALSDLEKFLHVGDELPIIIKAGLIHAQFETIHPFLDGNGRTGRMLITFYLWKEKFLEKPVLFLSSYFKKYQQIYYDKLLGYHNGNVEDWIEFFLDGVIEIAQEAIDIAGKITDLRQKDMIKIQKLGKKPSESALIVLPKLYAQPIVTASMICNWANVTRVGAKGIIDRFIELGILEPKDINAKYGRAYVYREYLEMFEDKY